MSTFDFFLDQPCRCAAPRSLFGPFLYSASSFLFFFFLCESQGHWIQGVSRAAFVIGCFVINTLPWMFHSSHAHTHPQVAPGGSPPTAPPYRVPSRAAAACARAAKKS